MKRIILLFVIFVVTWNTFSATKSPTNYIVYSVNGEPPSDCVISETTVRKEFSTLNEARRFAEDLAKDRKHWDIKIWNMQEEK